MNRSLLPGSRTIQRMSDSRTCWHVRNEEIAGGVSILSSRLLRDEGVRTPLNHVPATRAGVQMLGMLRLRVAGEV